MSFREFKWPPSSCFFSEGHYWGNTYTVRFPEKTPCYQVTSNIRRSHLPARRVYWLVDITLSPNVCYTLKKQLHKCILKIWKNVYIYIFPTAFLPRDRNRLYFQWMEKKKRKERKEFLNLETTVVAHFHLVKQLSVLRYCT